ncbi:MAG: hypothetical protein P8016_17460 [Sedimentisphaerales bacterium]
MKYKTLYFRRYFPIDRDIDHKVESFTNFLAEQVTEIPKSVVLSVKKDFLLLKSLTGFYKKALEKLSPDMAFLVNYYSLDGMAFTMACRELKIPTIDIQHGLQGDLHFAYGRWFKVPSTGFQLLPSFFWVWSNLEEAVIEKWSHQVSQYHRPLVGGNLWMSQWKGNADNTVTYYDKEILRLKESHSKAIHILVTLSGWNFDQVLLDRIRNVNQNIDIDIVWWIRLHPSWPEDGKKVRQIFKDYGISNYELEAASALPLYGLLKNIDLHLTHTSSVAYTTEEIISAINVQLKRKSQGALKSSESHVEVGETAIEFLMSVIKKEQHLSLN